MKARIYALALIAIGTGLLLSVAAANLIIDPAGIFGTSPLPPHKKNLNERYLSFTTFKTAEGQYDGLLFGSSRARAMPLDELSQILGAKRVALFTVNGGVLADHLPVLAYVVRNAREDQPTIRAVFVLLDVDAIGDRPPTNLGPATYLAPEVTGESKVRFWWKNLTGVTFLLWQNALREAFGPAQASGPGLSSIGADTIMTVLISTLSASAHAQELGPAALPERRSDGRERITERRQYRNDLERWRQLVALCRGASIELVAAFGPLRRENLDRYEDIGQVVDDFAAVGPIWDFSRFNRLADDGTLWGDESHYQADVARFMLYRIAGKAMPKNWEDFGRFYAGRRAP